MNNAFRYIVRQSFTTRAPFSATNFARFSSSAGTSTTPPPKTPTIDKDTLAKLVRTNKIVVFMKGNPEAPKCGFSNAVVQILRMHGVHYDSHDVLANEELRQSIKEFTDWPTIPQVFINGEFVGGCDILLQMHQSGDLIDELQKAGIESALLKVQEAKEKEKQEKK